MDPQQQCCVLLQWQRETKLPGSLLPEKTGWVSIPISHQFFSLPQSKTVIVSKVELIGINRNTRNKTLYHQRCLYLSFYMPIIPALFYLPSSSLFFNIFPFLSPIPYISRSFLLLPPPALPLVLPLPCFAMDSCRECVCAVCLYGMLWVASTGWLKGIKNDS